MAEPTRAALAGIEFFDHPKRDLLYRDEDHLRNAFAELDGKAFTATIPARDKYLTLVITVN